MNYKDETKFFDRALWWVIVFEENGKIIVCTRISKKTALAIVILMATIGGYTNIAELVGRLAGIGH
jgi:hypothetical protein